MLRFFRNGCYNSREFDGEEGESLTLNGPVSNSEAIEETFWEKVAKTRWGTYVTNVEKPIILWASALAKKENGLALDVGCGGGRWTKLLGDSGWDVICLDTDPSVLAICQQRAPAAQRVLVGPDDMTLPCQANRIDLLLCIEVYVIETDWFAAESFRVLKPGGLLVGVIRNASSLRGRYHLAKSPHDERASYNVSYPQWKDRFCRQGFKVIAERGLCWGPFSRASNSSLIPAFAGLERLLGLHHLPNLSPWVMFVAEKQTG
jgi:SAM-dependent methyltransferase